MKECDFTPGPWHVSNEGELVIRDDEWLVPVATAGYATNDEELATAKLIAAAPDLLEALQGYMSAVSEMNEAMKDGYNVQGAMSALIGWEDIARAAISKALGGGVMNKRYIVEVIERETKEVVKHFEFDNYRKADRVEEGLLRQSNLEKFDVVMRVE